MQGLAPSRFWTENSNWPHMTTGKLVVGVTGASGAIYAQRFLVQAAQA